MTIATSRTSVRSDDAHWPALMVPAAYGAVRIRASAKR
jgi:hypothetical protein